MGRSLVEPSQDPGKQVPNIGYDARIGQYVDMVSAGVVDPAKVVPAKVVRVALQDAASIAGLMITTEAMVAETPKKK